MSNLLSPGVNVLIDGQWGSTGKGKLAAFLASKCDVAFATADFQPNAGHTVRLEGKDYVTKSIPSGFVNRDAQLYLTPASTISIPTLMRELELLADFKVADRLSIHPMAAVVTREDVLEEQETMGRIASTMTGGGVALQKKIARRASTARDFDELKPWVRDRSTDVWASAKAGQTVLAETAQGFDLSLNHGFAYPFVTSRDVTTASVLANLGVPPQLMSRCWASMRTFPIRVGHLVRDGEKVGDSGPFYPDQQELTWNDITRLSGSSAPLQELTTVTKRVRRIFTWSDQQYARFLRTCMPTDVFVNFVNYLDASVSGQNEWGKMTGSVWDFLQRVARTGQNTVGSFAPVIRLLGTGADHNDMVEVCF